MQRRRDLFVEVVQIARCAHPSLIEDSRVAAQLGGRLALERVQEVPGIDAVETTGQMVPGDAEVERGADCCCGVQAVGGFGFPFAKPLEQRIAAQRDADCVAQAVGMELLQAAQNPVDLVAVARMVGAWQAIELARACLLYTSS